MKRLPRRCEKTANYILSGRRAGLIVSTVSVWTPGNWQIAHNSSCGEMYCAVHVKICVGGINAPHTAYMGASECLFINKSSNTLVILLTSSFKIIVVIYRDLQSSGLDFLHCANTQ